MLQPSGDIAENPNIRNFPKQDFNRLQPNQTTGINLGEHSLTVTRTRETNQYLIALHNIRNNQTLLAMTLPLEQLPLHTKTMLQGIIKGRETLAMQQPPPPKME